MKLGVFVLSFVTLLGVSALGCAAPTSEPNEDGAPSEAAESELTRTKFTRLDEATASEVADTFVATFNRQLDEVLAAHPNVAMITKSNVGNLTSVGTTFYIDLGDALKQMLTDRGQQSAKPSTLKGYARTWALAKLAPFVVDGKVKFTGIDPLMIYEATSATEERLAIERAVNPRGANLATLRTQWQRVQSDRGNLDSSYLRPVKVDREPTLTEMKRHFKISSRASMESFGWEAVDGFANAGEGPDGAASFNPLRQTLKHSIGIKKRWLFTGGGDGWSTNVLVILDEKNQLWGFSMGYSE